MSRCNVASNWSFSQFKVGAFQELLNAGFELEVPSPKVESHEMDWDGEENHIACLAHVINLAVQAFLKNIKVTQMTELERFALPGSAPAPLSAPPPIPTTSKRRRPKQECQI